MLGVRRATVTVVAGMLQQSGIITYKRGTVTILDDEALEAATCECYRKVNDEYERLLGPAT
jgi:DNA-binding transcriptional regulator YhcF (GntR family)